MLKLKVIKNKPLKLKVDIEFSKVGHKRLMARFAGLEII